MYAFVRACGSVGGRRGVHIHPEMCSCRRVVRPKAATRSLIIMFLMLTGGLMGFWLVKKFQAREYSWLSVRKIPTAVSQLSATTSVLRKYTNDLQTEAGMSELLSFVTVALLPAVYTSELDRVRYSAIYFPALARAQKSNSRWSMPIVQYYI